MFSHCDSSIPSLLHSFFCWLGGRGSSWLLRWPQGVAITFSPRVFCSVPCRILAWRAGLRPGETRHQHLVGIGQMCKPTSVAQFGFGSALRGADLLGQSFPDVNFLGHPYPPLTRSSAWVLGTCRALGYPLAFKEVAFQGSRHIQGASYTATGQLPRAKPA